MSLFNKLLEKEQSDVLPGEADTASEKPADFFFCLNMKKYFEVEEQELKQRMMSAVMLKPTFKQVVKDRPDLYGPFWIASTLIVIIIASASLITFFSSTADGKKPEYDFTKIPVAASLIYGICFGAPYLIAIMIRIFGGSASVVEVICVYGYSMTVFLPITALCFIKLALVHVLLLTAGYVISTLFLIRGILSMDRKLGDKEKMVLGVFILGVQLIMVLMYKFYFFQLY